jgi:hypothetical protein
MIMILLWIQIDGVKLKKMKESMVNYPFNNKDYLQKIIEKC